MSLLSPEYTWHSRSLIGSEDTAGTEDGKPPITWISVPKLKDREFNCWVTEDERQYLEGTYNYSFHNWNSVSNWKDPLHDHWSERSLQLMLPQIESRRTADIVKQTELRDCVIDTLQFDNLSVLTDTTHQTDSSSEQSPQRKKQRIQ